MNLGLVVSGEVHLELLNVFAFLAAGRARALAAEGGLAADVVPRGVELGVFDVVAVGLSVKDLEAAVGLVSAEVGLRGRVDEEVCGSKRRAESNESSESGLHCG